MNKYLNLLLASSVFSFSLSSHADDPTNNMFGIWGSLTLQGDFQSLSPSFNNFVWLVMNQTRTRDDSSAGSRVTENLLFSQVGYQFNEHASAWLGYVHDWLNPLDKPSFQESRPYEDFVWRQNFGDTHFMSRTRMEQRINETTGDTGYRARELLQLNHPLPFMEGFSAYVGDEVLWYMNKTKWGSQGFSENRVLAGLSYQVTHSIGMDLGYMGQYINTISGSNLFTHNLQANVTYKF